MNNTEDSGFEEDNENKVLLDPGRSHSSSSSLIMHNEAKKSEIIPFIPLVQSGISLEPDMLFGWKPKTLINGGPIPINFTMESIPTKGCIYYGFRPEDSLELHEMYSGKDSYPFTVDITVKQAYKIVKKKNPKKETRPFVGMKVDADEDVLVFDSKFESGNLDKVSRVKENEYDLYIRNDSNTYGRNQWFYFTARNKSGEKVVKMNIVNFCKQDSLYSQGQQPLIFRIEQPEKGWHYLCDKVKYGYSKINKILENRRPYFSLSFSFTFPANETLKFAYSLPYTYSDLLKYLLTLDPLPCVRREVMCKSLSGVEIPVLTISNFSNPDKKEIIFTTARVHPGETHGSWMMQGFLDFITSDAFDAVRLRNLCIFKIIPMLNPDGVILGNARCSINGQDLNRQFHSPDNRLHPEIFHLKNLIQINKDILTYLDFHSHSKKKGIFFYGPYFPLHSEFHYKIRVIPKLLSEISEMFRYYSCKFRNDWSKRKAARLVIAKEQCLPYSYTIEASAFGFFNSERVTVSFDQPILLTIGEQILTSILQFIDLRNDELKNKELRAEMRRKNKGVYKEEEKKRTMEDLLELIKKEMNEDESDSGGSNSDSDKEEQEEKVNKKILNLLKQVSKMVLNPTFCKRYSHSQAPKVNAKVHKKNEESEVQAKSTLAKYFSRASTDNRSKFKYRAESTKRPAESEKKPSVKPISKPREIISKFSYSRGLYALKPRNNMIFDKSVLKSKKPTIRLENKINANINLGAFLDGIDPGFASDSEGESTRNHFDMSVIMKRNSKYQSTEKIN